MVQSVELLLDAELEQHVLSEWGRLVHAGLPSQGRHTGASNRPHVTLAVAAHLTAGDELAITAVARELMPLDVRLGGLLVFGAGPFVLARGVVPSVGLLRLQQRVALLMPAAVPPFGHQSPGGWSAHVTLARRLDARELGDAVTTLSPIADLSGVATEIRRWDSDRRIDWLIT